MSEFPDYTIGIKETGFILEFKIAQLLKNNDFNVISNKYYEDDLQEVVREIDIIAYKCYTFEDVLYYTVLMISCKKNTENCWALLSRDIDYNDSNSDWNPLHLWSNDTVLNDIVEDSGFKSKYFEYMRLQKISSVQIPAYDIFAFQEMNRKNGRAQNDKNIFSSITTLMKAQAYEIGALPSRKKDKCIYQFNLVSIIDSDIFRLDISDDTIIQNIIDTEQMITRYIVNRKEQFYNIRFSTANFFETLVTDYSKLAYSNFYFIKSLRENWYLDVFKDYRKVALLEKDFFKELEILFESQYLSHHFTGNSHFISMESDFLGIYVTNKQEVSDELNEKSKIKEKVAEMLRRIFHYQGNFRFDSDILPF